MYSFDYMYWNFIKHLLERDYELVQAPASFGEAWLEAGGSAPYDLIRIYRQDIDFRQELVRDLESLAERTERLRAASGRRKLSVLTVYLSQQAPVDEWEDVVSHSVEGKRVSIAPIFIDEASIEEGLKKIAAALHIHTGGWTEDIKDATYEEAVKVRDEVLEAAKRREEERKREAALFERGTPIVTWFFAGLQVIMFLLLEIAGGSQNTETLIRFGAKENSLILAGEWWRLLTPIVLHIGLVHLLFNTFALLSVGAAAERVYGSFRFLAIYITAGVFGSIGSFLFSPYPSAGASGAIFGCLGALLFLAFSNRKAFLKTIGTNIIVIIILNLGLGFAVSNIDNAGHIGGLIGGLLSAMAVGLPGKRNAGLRVIGWVLVLVIGGGALYWGFHSVPVQESALLYNARKWYEEGEYEKVRNALQEAAGRKDASSDILKILAISEIQLGEYDTAEKRLAALVRKDPSDHASFYYMAVLYVGKGELKKAEQSVEQALKEKPDEKMYQMLKNEIINELDK
ncbi:peptidase S54 [Bacillus glycinifermentans]|uniref:Peptidase S54 n=1 Tax=Bacillus glycinifermentans TaxID=1664069 RepID=A0A0J6F229_9BACI|nr:rhomboid family intramembrane serine protease [Bacillus glycinifermentans]ATH92397.1 rhomboid family intramembrane serine protease [Bacillus glycinifermentans]KMM63340.1 peptidase S54 [Bacillus glycinifermentans]KRT95143.1 peptidase S54 [Bacillus glycinifermentans]MEC0484930.1 rhomboid family intramembrane serine protease [Bacillus glycinifermentans]MEC0496040.1 rhomboid family intramembrane serine protease [Bacillus glycinifermentans]